MPGPLTVFDAVGKFSADSSQLDQFIVKLERGLTTASEKAAASTQALKAAQDEFRASIKAVSAEGGNTVDNLERLAQAEKNLALSAAAAKQEHVALKTELLGTQEATGLASQAADEFGSHIGKMFGVIAAAEGFKSLIEGTQKSVLELQLLSEKTGIAIETLAGVQHVAEASGVSFDEVGSALTRLSRSQALAIEGGKSQVAAFQRIGISVNELKTLSPEQLFYRVADAMANSKSHAEENATAFTILGRGGAALIPIFQQNGEALRGMVQEAAAASGVTKEAGQAALEWQTQIANITEKFRAGLIPVMEILVPIIKVIEELSTDTAMTLRDLGAAVGGLFLAEFDSVKGVTSVFADVMDGNFKKAASDAKDAAGVVSHDILGIGDQFKDNFQNTADYIKQIWKKTDPLKPLKDDLSDLGNKNNGKAAQKAAQAQIEAQKIVGDAVLALIKSQGIEELQANEQNYSLQNAATKQAFVDQLSALTQIELQKRAIAAKADDDVYQLQLRTLQAELDELKKSGKDTTAEQTRVNAEIEALHFRHQAKILDSYTKAMATLKKVMSQPIPLVNAVPPEADQIANDITRGFDKAEEAAKSLGITLTTDLGNGLREAFAAYSKLDELFKQGIVTQKDLDNGYIKLTQAQLKYALETGASATSVKKLEDELKRLLQAQLAEARAEHASIDVIKKLEKEIKNLNTDQHQVAGTFKQSGPILQAYQQEMEQTGSVAESVAAAMGEAITATTMAYASGSETIVGALAKIAQAEIQGIASIADKKGTEQLAEAFGSWPDAAAMAQHFAAATLWFSLGGALAAASGALSGVGSSSNSSSSSASSGTAAPAAGSVGVSAAPQPVQVINTQHLATGGVATEPTLVTVGDSESGSAGSEEAIIPLRNRNALDMIAQALLPGLLAGLTKDQKQDFAHQPFFPSSLLHQPTLLAPSTIAAASANVTGAAGESATEKLLTKLVEGKIPHSDSRTLAAAASVKHDINIKLEADIPQLVKRINPMVESGRVTLKSTKTTRVTRKS